MASATPFGTRLVAAALGVLLAVIGGIASPADAAAPMTLTITPEIAENTAVKAPQKVVVTGTAAGTTIESARLIALDADGERDHQQIGDGTLNRTPAPVTDVDDYLRVADGQISGRLTLGCLFATAPNVCVDEGVKGVILEVTIDAETGKSNELRVDYVRPQLRAERQLIAPDQVLVRFTEPVRQPLGEMNGQGTPADWRIDGTPLSVTAVDVGAPAGTPDCIYEAGEDSSAGSKGCARVLHLAEPQHEDATPDVEYWLIGSNVPDRSEHLDFASNRYLERDTSPRVAPALDFIRPAAPTIDSIDGKSPVGDEALVLSSSVAPTVTVGNVLEGHTVELTIDGDSASPRTLTKQVPATTDAVDFDLSGLTDGGYNLSAVAIDPHGNRSTDTDLQTKRPDGTPEARYVLDTEAPQLLAAANVDKRTVTATFSEPILPAGNAGTWTVAGMNVTAEGSGHTRRLVSPVDLPSGGLVKWSPTSESAKPGTVDRYGDRAGNGLAAISGIPLDALPPVPAPTVTNPTSVRYVNTNTARISGTAPSGSNLVAELFNAQAEEPIAEAAVANRTWSFDQPLTADGRYEFQVRMRNTSTGVVSPRVEVPDIVRDTAAPVVDVTAPTLVLPGPDNATGQQQLAAGDPVTIEWIATDAAAGDPVRPDHGDTVMIVMENEAGSRRAIASGIQHQPGRKQTHTYTLRSSDIPSGQAQQSLTFDVIVTDLARNAGVDTSDPVLLLAGRVGFTPVLTKVTKPGQVGIIEARFPVAMEGETQPADWQIDGVPVQTLSQKDTGTNGATIVRLHAPLIIDPNATPQVRYQALAPDVNPTALRTASEGAWVTNGERQTLDRVIPEFTVQRPATPAVIDAKSVTFTGTTDQTNFPNGVAAYRSDAAGNRVGSAIATGQAGGNGEWSLNVPLTPNARNLIVLQAYDPSGNRSATRPSDPYSVVEDSIAPVVRLRQPKSASTLGPTKAIRWSTSERHKKYARLQYRAAGGSWQTIASATRDDGYYKWTLPRHLARKTFIVAVTSVDQTGKSGTHRVRGLRADFRPPVMTGARAIGQNKVRVYFNEPMRMSRRGFTVDGIGLRRTKGRGSSSVLITRKYLDRTTPIVRYKGRAVTDRFGNRLARTRERASRGFVFPVTKFRANRTSTYRVVLKWRDNRNRPAHVKGYRIYRDGRYIALVRGSTRFVDRVSGRHRYVVRAVDDRGRVSGARTDRVR